MDSVVHVPRGKDLDVLRSKLQGVAAINKNLKITFDERLKP